MAGSSQKRWTPVELRILETRRAQKVEPKMIAEELGRTINSVVMRCQIDNRRRWRARQHRDEPARVQIEAQYVAPPAYVTRERDIRLSIPRRSATAVVFCDPVEGYSGLETRFRKISVQDALEICAMSTGDRTEIAEFAKAYFVSPFTIKSILSGDFFELLLPKSQPKPSEIQ
jgi:hypothetical protein